MIKQRTQTQENLQECRQPPRRGDHSVGAAMIEIKKKKKRINFSDFPSIFLKVEVELSSLDINRPPSVPDIKSQYLVVSLSSPLITPDECRQSTKPSDL